MEDHKDLKYLIVEFYQSLFSSSTCSNQEFVLQTIPQVVIEDINYKLIAPFSSKKLRIVVISMEADKVPGFDGMPRFFIRVVGT